MSDENNINEGFPGKNKPGKEGFGLPEGYFDSFTSKLFNRMEAEKELAEFKLLSSVPKQNTFSVPDNYFENLALRTEAKAELSVYERLAAFKNAYPAIAPDNYFEFLAERLQHRIEVFEETKAFATLSSLDKVNCFSVSDDYFEALPYKVKDRIHEAKPAAVFDWLREIVFTRRLAYAFGLVLVIGFTVLFLYKANERIIGQKRDCGTMACLEKKEIINSGYLKNLDEESIIEMIDVNALSDSLNKQNNKQADKEALDFVLENTDATSIIDEL
ncbi:MAG: hypothetical protein ACJ76F_09320 [Bacteroidia bacterium]